MHTTAADGTRLWWEAEGSGPPVLFVPGRGDSTDRFPALFAERLHAAGLSTIRYDARDTGLSADGGDSYTVADLADDAVAVLDAAGVASAHAVGISMGGMLLLLLATRHPDRVRSLTFVSPWSPDPDAGVGEDLFAETDPDPVAAMVGSMGEADDADRAWAAEECHRAGARAPMRADAGDRHQAAIFRLGWPSLDDLAAVHRPAVVVHGTEDRSLPLAHGEAVARGIPGARLVVRDGMGHLPRPADWEVAADLVADLAR